MNFREELQPNRLIPSLTAGVVVGIIRVSLCFSYAVFIFSGPLTEYLPWGIGMLLFSGAVVSFWLALTSSAENVVAHPQPQSTAVLALLVPPIVAQMSPEATGEALFLTTIAAIALSTLITACAFWGLGWLKLGNLIRFFPYPVIGGFIAGSGWLLVRSPLQAMAARPLTFTTLPSFFQADIFYHWFSGVVFGTGLLMLSRRYNHWSVVPGSLLGAIALFYAVLGLTQTEINTARVEGWLLANNTEGGLWHPLTWQHLTQIEWSVLWQQTPHFATIALVSVVSLLLNVSGIELAVAQDMDLDQELRTVGLGNLVAGFGSGAISYHALGSSVLPYRMGAKSRLVGVGVAVVSAIALICGSTMVAFLPKFVLGGLTLFLGFGFLWEWVIEARHKLPRLDYVIVWGILLVVASFGFLEGVSLGLAVAIATFAVNYSRINPVQLTFSGASYPSQVIRLPYQKRILAQKGQQILILVLHQFLFFGTAHKLLEYIQQRLLAPTQEDPKLDINAKIRFILLDFSQVSGLDSSAVRSFVRIQQIASQHEITLVFSHLRPSLLSQLQQGGCFDHPQPHCQQWNIFPDLERALEWCEDQIIHHHLFPYRRLFPDLDQWLEQMQSEQLILELQAVFGDIAKVQKFLHYLEPREFPAAHTLFHQGDTAEGLYLVASGQLSAYLEQSDGEINRLWRFNPGSIVGKTGLSSDQVRLSSVITDQPSLLYYLSPAALQHLSQEAPDLALQFEHFLLQLLCEERLNERQRAINKGVRWD
ncbi:SulP family inorganic anion transporter [Spirulina subsalsa]|uniref:SulP family inorganic anion transporter n=1 Tax=Spirulina subsalsa TaxID=54311 RepID=UPI0002FA4628|nr:SulP family inorganic anion transporter [Spirulina subsalsa]